MVDSRSYLNVRGSRRGGGGRGGGMEKKIKIFTKNLENAKIGKNIEKINKNVDFGGATN